jgi:UDP-N-acetylglucosamine 2-epimerase (non-hydrolysing)
MRDNTERPVTVEIGTNILGGTRRESIAQAIRTQLTLRGKKSVPELWDGRAAARIVGILADRFMSADVLPAGATNGQIVENAR